MAPSKPSDDDLKSLATVVANTQTLIKQLETVLFATATNKPLPSTTSSSSSPSSASGSSTTLDPLSLAHDAASLIRAHTTKLSLLIINEPFTPSAIVKVLREVNAGPVPGLASAVEVCDPARCTGVARRELAWRSYRALHEFRALVDVVPLGGKVLRTAAGENNNKKNNSNKAGSLAATGVIWNACDDVMNLKKLGVAGLLVKKVEEYRDTLKDVLEELKEWSEEVEEEEEEEEDDGDDNNDNDTDNANEAGNSDALATATTQMQNTHISNQELLDDLMSTQTIPRGDPDRIRPRLASCLKRLRLTTLLYSAVIKRRLKTLPPTTFSSSSSPPATQLSASETSSSSSSIPRRLDEVLPVLKQLPPRFNDLACAFYELDGATIDRLMDACFFDAFAVSEMLARPWTAAGGRDDGSSSSNRDEFTDWAEKFQVSIKTPD